MPEPATRRPSTAPGSARPTGPLEIVLVSDTLPIDRGGSFVVLQRHLQPLVQEGSARLHVVSKFTVPEEARFWRHISPPRRRPWWPPARTFFPPSFSLHARCEARTLARQLPDARSRTVVLTQLWGSRCIVAAELSRLRGWPLGVFWHDDEITWDQDPGRFPRWRRNHVCRHASRIWPVSARLTALLPETERDKCTILRPVPGARSPRTTIPPPTPTERFRLGYSGKVYPGLDLVLLQLGKLLSCLGGSLLVISDAETIAGMNGRPGIETCNSYPTSAEALSRLEADCHALLVAYPPAANAGCWRALRTSFPSKLLDYSQLRRPLVILGDSDSELGDWCRATPDAPFFTSVESPGLARYLDRLRNPADYADCSAWTARLADSSFAPEALQGLFVAELQRLLPRPPSV